MIVFDSGQLGDDVWLCPKVFQAKTSRAIQPSNRTFVRIFNFKRMPLSNAALRERYRKFARQSWSPETAPGDPAALQSRFSGLPFLLEGESWPVCGNCGKELQLYLQLDLKTIPPAAQERIGLRAGILQLFYCTGDCGVDGWEPFSKEHLQRVIPPDATAALAPAVPASLQTYFPTKIITGWSEFEDFPSPEEEAALPEMSDDDYDTYYVSEPYLNADGDKLCGWPNWIQGEEYPDCPECGRKMQMVFQLDSWPEAHWMWGDAGVGHITQCPEHRSLLAFGWACA
jgi:uncharacterized protein YwqG